jgi:hypothetical protein
MNNSLLIQKYKKGKKNFRFFETKGQKFIDVIVTIITSSRNEHVSNIELENRSSSSRTNTSNLKTICCNKSKCGSSWYSCIR